MPHVLVPQRCGLTISLFEDENALEFNVVTEQSKILGFFDILEAATNAIYETVENYNKPCVCYDGRCMHGPK